MRAAFGELANGPGRVHHQALSGSTVRIKSHMIAGTIAIFLISVLSQPASARIFTDQQGREVEAEISHQSGEIGLDCV